MDGVGKSFLEQVPAPTGCLPRIGPYVLLERLGRGGMGHVYKAEHRLMKRVVALKLLGQLRSDCDHSAAQIRFRREVEAAGRLRHPNIVTAYDAGIWQGRPYLVMEYIEGIDLERLVEDTGPLTIDLACEIVRQTAEALHHAHERGLVHRDIKPANLMLAPPGVTVKLLDLGLAKLTSKPLAGDEENEADNELCGTPDYMAPEWGCGSRSADVRSDLYSLGCTFYFLLAGQVPYPGGSWTEKLLRHSLDAPTPLRSLRPDIPVPIASIVERLMARNAENRYASAEAVASEIGALRIPAAIVPTNERIEDRKPIPRRRRSSRGPARLSCSALIAMLLGVAAAGGARWMVAPQTPSPKGHPETNGLPFTIEGRSHGFASLANAITSAEEGAIITIHGPGPYVMAPVSWEGKALILRAASGSRPRLEMQPGDDPWHALLQTDRVLTLEGLDLAISGDSSEMHPAPAACLIRCIQAPLYLRNCRLNAGAEGTAVVARNASEVFVRDCQIEAGTVGLSIEIEQGRAARIRMEDTRLSVRGASGAALLLWTAEARQSGPVELQLERNTIEAARITAVRSVSSTFTVMARGNRFVYQTALLSYTGFAKHDAWRKTDWQGSDNSFRGPSSWLQVEGKPIALMEQPPLR